MTVTLPPGEGMPSNHDPFPNTKAYIEGIEDTVSFYLDMLWKMLYELVRIYIYICKNPDPFYTDSYFYRPQQ